MDVYWPGIGLCDRRSGMTTKSANKDGESAKRFSVDARTILQLGRQSIKDHTTALVELVKNSYDADASVVEVDIEAAARQIRIADDGVGMAESVFDEQWLRIGHSAKRHIRWSPSGSRRVVGIRGTLVRTRPSAR